MPVPEPIESLAMQAIDYAINRSDGLVWLRDWRDGDPRAVEDLQDEIHFQAMARLARSTPMAGIVQTETEGLSS